MTEAITVVTPMEVIKIRLQSQSLSVQKESRVRQSSRGAWTLLSETVRTEGLSALYRGVSLTTLRQGSNQAVSLSTFTYTKDVVRRIQPQYAGTNLPSWQITLIGLLSGVIGPLSNHPIDTIKTRLQSTSFPVGSTSWKRVMAPVVDIFE